MNTTIDRLNGWTQWEVLDPGTGELHAYQDGGRYGLRGVPGEWWKIVFASDGVPVCANVYGTMEAALREIDRLA
jgi:hypothetical protein